MSAVAIVLAAHNGERFIAEQIESIRAQTWNDWELIVRDDGSSDDTREIVAGFARRDARIRVLPASERVGAWRNFAILLRHALDAGYEYVLLSDQDDVWMPSKVERTLDALRSHETRAGPARPALVHTDLAVVDERMRRIHRSYRAYQRVRYDRTEPLRTLLLHNAPMGCTMGCNRALLKIAVPLPDGVFHDWWLAQIAAAAGDVLDIPEPLVAYRQHGHNVIGTGGRYAALSRVLHEPARFVRRVFGEFRASATQACVLAARLRQYAARLPPERAAIIANYVGAYGTINPVRRLRRILRSGVRPTRPLSHPFFFGLALCQPRITVPAAGDAHRV